VNEAAIFRMIALRREIVETAAKERKQARRDKARRSHLTEVPASVLEAPPDYLGASGEVSRVKPFDDIEEW